MPGFFHGAGNADLPNQSPARFIPGLPGRPCRISCRPIAIIGVNNIAVSSFDMLRLFWRATGKIHGIQHSNRHGHNPGSFSHSLPANRRAAGKWAISAFGAMSPPAKKMGPSLAIFTASERTWQVIRKPSKGLERGAHHRPGRRKFPRYYWVAHLEAKPHKLEATTSYVDGGMSINLAPDESPTDPVLDGGAFRVPASLSGYAAGRHPTRFQDFAIGAAWP